VACSSCGKKYPGAQTPEQAEAARAARAAKRAEMVQKLAQAGPVIKLPLRVPIGRNRVPSEPANRGYRPVPTPAAPGGGPGYPEKLLVKGKK
jgi:hypothetical protein